MKNHLIQVRISEEEFQSLQENCANAGMSVSEYMRSLMSNSEIKSIGNKREIMAEVCKMLSVLNQMEDTPEKDKIMEGANHICQFLR